VLDRILDGPRKLMDLLFIGVRCREENYKQSEQQGDEVGVRNQPAFVT